MTEHKVTKEQAFWIAQYFGSICTEGWSVEEVEEAILLYLNHVKGPVLENKERDEAQGFTYEP